MEGIESWSRTMSLARDDVIRKRGTSMEEIQESLWVDPEESLENEGVELTRSITVGPTRRGGAGGGSGGGGGRLQETLQQLGSSTNLLKGRKYALWGKAEHQRHSSADSIPHHAVVLSASSSPVGRAHSKTKPSIKSPGMAGSALLGFPAFPKKKKAPVSPIGQSTPELDLRHTECSPERRRGGDVRPPSGSFRAPREKKAAQQSPAKPRAPSGSSGKSQEAVLSKSGSMPGRLFPAVRLSCSHDSPRSTSTRMMDPFEPPAEDGSLASATTPVSQVKFLSSFAEYRRRVAEAEQKEHEDMAGLERTGGQLAEEERVGAGHAEVGGRQMRRRRSMDAVELDSLWGEESADAYEGKGSRRGVLEAAVRV